MFLSPVSKANFIQYRQSVSDMMHHEWCFIDEVKYFLPYLGLFVIHSRRSLFSHHFYWIIWQLKNFSSLKDFPLIQWFQFVLLPLRCSFSPRQMSFLEFLETEMKNLKTSKRWNWVQNLTSVRIRSWKG